MTIEEKRKCLERCCEKEIDCISCPLGSDPEAMEKCEDYTWDEMDESTLDYLLSIISPNKEDPINPPHYTDGKIEVIEFIEDKKLGFCLGNAIKYISRAGKKDPTKEIEDLKKAKWYIERRIKELEVTKND